MDNLVERARCYGTAAHARINQFRKYTLKPYEVHLRAVAGLVASVTDDQAMIAASWLHDTVEDTPATFEDLEREFGADVMELVKDLTDVSKPGDGNRARRKAADLRHTAAASARAKTIKLADIIDNCEDICRHDPKFGRVYLQEMKALMEVLAEGDYRLFELAANKLAACERKLGAASSDPEVTATDPLSLLGIPAGRHGIRLFTAAFTARDIQEPLCSFDRATLSSPGRNGALESPAAVYGIREQGVVTGYVAGDDPADNGVPPVRRFDPRQMVALESSLADVIQILTHFRFCFVTLDGAVVGVIGRGDIEKPVVRMWLFGVIILIEMLVVNLIRRRWPDGSWFPLVSAGRLEKAKLLQAERIRRGLNADLIDCLQLSDKVQLALREQRFVEGAGFQSLAAARRALKDLESLRNNLAHGQDITSHDWPPIARLAQRVEDLFGGWKSD